MERLSCVTAHKDARRNVGKEGKKKTRQGREDIIRLISTKNKNECLGESVTSKENNE